MYSDHDKYLVKIELELLNKQMKDLKSNRKGFHWFKEFVEASLIEVILDIAKKKCDEQIELCANTKNLFYEDIERIKDTVNVLKK